MMAPPLPSNESNISHDMGDVKIFFMYGRGKRLCSLSRRLGQSPKDKKTGVLRKRHLLLLAELIPMANVQF
jgi:hypothetical protein